MCQVGSYRTVVVIERLTLFIKRKPFICAIPLFSTIKELCFIHTLIGVKYNKTLKALTLCCMKDTALGEGLVTNIALRRIFATQLSPRAVYFIQTGGSALSNTYSGVTFYKGVHPFHKKLPLNFSDTRGNVPQF